MVYIVCACSKFASGAVICFVELVKVLWAARVRVNIPGSSTAPTRASLDRTLSLGFGFSHKRFSFSLSKLLLCRFVWDTRTPLHLLLAYENLTLNPQARSGLFATGMNLEPRTNGDALLLQHE